MTTSRGKLNMKNILLNLTMTLTLLTLAACGGGGGGSGSVPPPTAKTTALLTINLTGALPAGTAISGADFTITLPANVTPTLSNGAVVTGVVVNSGTLIGSTVSPQVVYTAATGNTPGTIKVILTSSATAGVTQVGEVATIALQLANGVVPSAGSFLVSADHVFDATIISQLSGMNVVVSSVTLQ
jgi:hypothetical protein